MVYDLSGIHRRRAQPPNFLPIMKKTQTIFLPLLMLPACLPAHAEQAAGVVSSLFVQNGSAAPRAPAAKLKDVIDAADYIVSPGASNAADQAGVQSAITEANKRGGGRVRVRKPISNGWSLSALKIPASVLIDDERYSDAGHTVAYGTGNDVESRIHGTSLKGGEGPSFVAVNNATNGDRTSSIVSRYGAGAGTGVGTYMHMGVWDGSRWFPEFDMITSGADGFRSTLRIGYGTVQVNAAWPGAHQYTNNKFFSVNKPAALGGGNLFEVNTTTAKFAGNVVLSPASAATPEANGQMTFALISNTLLEIRVKGSDGVVRKAALTLAP